jgi:type II secretory pathway component PulF
MLLASNFGLGFGEFLVSLLFYALFGLLPIGVFAIVLHLLYSIPFRRRERASFFIDLVETAVESGKSLEYSILSASKSHDRELGVRFYLVAAHIEAGRKLGEALERVPSFLPPQISAMIRTGERLGDLRSILPACREVLRDAPAAVRSAVHYMVALLLVFSPIAVWLIFLMGVFVIPKFKDLVGGMNIHLGPISILVFRHPFFLIGFETTLFALLVVAAVIYVGGPRFVRWFQFREVPVVDWIAWQVPWKRKRMQRTFSAMLAVLLDGGVPEVEAVKLAGDSTANDICRRRAQKISAALAQGVPLAEAVRAFDDTGEFHWRLSNATQGGGGFLKTLRGWHEALDAKAFQQEEATAHVVTSGLVILNGIVVALLAMATFGVLVAILNGMLTSL